MDPAHPSPSSIPHLPHTYLTPIPHPVPTADASNFEDVGEEDEFDVEPTETGDLFDEFEPVVW